MPVRKDLANPPFDPALGGTRYAWIQHFIHLLWLVGGAGFDMAKRTRSAHSCPMKMIEDDPSRGRVTAEQGLTEEDALICGMESMLIEFVEREAVVYAKV